MSGSREGGSVHIPPVLDGSNYGYWKARMTAFLKTLDHKAWKSVINGWEAPKDGQNVKAESEWTDAEDTAALGNSCALNAIFNVVDQNVFRMINTCEVAKDAWNILATAYEGTNKVKEQKL